MKNKLRNFINISNIHNSDIDYVSIIFLCLEKLEYKMFQYAALYAIQKNILCWQKNIPVAKD